MHFSMQLFSKEENMVLLVGIFPMNGWILTLIPHRCSSKCIWINNLPYPTKLSIISLLKLIMVEELLMIKMLNLSLHFFSAILTQKLWKAIINLPVQEFIINLVTSLFNLSKAISPDYLLKMTLKFMVYIKMLTSPSNRKMWKNLMKPCSVCNQEQQEDRQKVDKLLMR